MHFIGSTKAYLYIKVQLIIISHQVLEIKTKMIWSKKELVQVNNYIFMFKKFENVVFKLLSSDWMQNLKVADAEAPRSMNF